MALPVAVAVLVVTCPCALSLATPMVMAVASARLARIGLIVTRAGAIEAFSRATHFVFDKTGTLTEGRLHVDDIVVLGESDRDRVLGVAAALERQSEHPIGKAILAAAGPDLPPVAQVSNHPGKGLAAVVACRATRIGQKSFVEELSGPMPGGQNARAPVTAVWLGDSTGPLARFDLKDRVRDDAKALVRELRASGGFVMLLSGDGPEAVEDAAAHANILYYRSRMLPDQKQEAVLRLQESGAVVAMIGDGINDAPVLAQAQVSIAMGTGAALAQGAADMVLVSHRLSDVGRAHRLSRKALRIVRQNLTWAFAYNVIALPLAMGGWLTPWMAGIGMSASSLLVVLNALRTRDPG